MKVVVGSNEKISKLIAEEFIKQVQEKPNSVLGLATGTSPIDVYANMIKACKEGRVSFKDNFVISATFLAHSSTFASSSADL